MALQAVTHGLAFPAYPTDVRNTAPGYTNILLDANGEKAALVIGASAAKNIHKLHFYLGTVTTGDTIAGRVETVDDAANGDPTGTLWAANTSGTVVVADGDDAAWKSITLTADATMAVGDRCALCLVNGASGVLNIRADGRQLALFPYGDHFTAAWAKVDVPLLVPEYSDGSFEPIPGFTDIGGPVNTQTFNSGSTTNRRGNLFQVAFPSRVKSCWVWVDLTGPFTVKLYDSDGTTVLATTATHTQFQRTAATPGLVFLPFLTTATLVAGTTYRVAIVPTSTTNLSAYDFDVPAAGMLDLFAGGQACQRSVYTSGAWVQTTTSRSYLGVFLDAFDDGVSAGGGVPIIGGSIIRTVNRAA